VNELSPHNMYESMILSTIPWKGLRIESYKYSREKHETEIKKLQKLEKMWYPMDEQVFKKKDKTFSGNYKEGTTFEADLHFKSSENIFSFQELLQNCVEVLYPLTEMKEESLTDKWVYIEITASPALLLQKLFQLERAVRLLPLIDPTFKPEALCVLMNGDEKVAKNAISLVKNCIPKDANILQFPLYLGWAPTRNMYTSFAKLSDEVTSWKKIMGSQLDRLDKDVKGLDARMDSLDRDVKGLDARMDSLDRNVKHLDARMDSLEKKIDSLVSIISNKFSEKTF